MWPSGCVCCCRAIWAQWASRREKNCGAAGLWARSVPGTPCRWCFLAAGRSGKQKESIDCTQPICLQGKESGRWFLNVCGHISHALERKEHLRSWKKAAKLGSAVTGGEKHWGKCRRPITQAIMRRFCSSQSEEQAGTSPWHTGQQPKSLQNGQELQGDGSELWHR